MANGYGSTGTGRNKRNQDNSSAPRTGISSKGDLIDIIQNGVRKQISKIDLLKQLDDAIKSVSAEVKSVKRQVSKRTIDKNSPSFGGPVSASAPRSQNHLATKGYVDSITNNVIKNDGTTALTNNLSYRNAPVSFKDNDVITKKFVDDELKATLKTIQREKGDHGYPKASAGDSFIIEEDNQVFATDGPEVQAGDLILCIENSEGGTHGSVGHQYAIVNTNVVFSTEEKAGILRVATEEDLTYLDAADSALTPEKYKRALELGSEYNRTIVSVPNYSLTEEEKGIIGVDCRRNAVTLTLPSISRLSNPKILKYLIKDEYGNSVKNNITLVTSGGNTIQGGRTYLINSNNASVKLYNDGEDKWYLESNVSSGAETSQGVKTFVTSDINAGEKATTTGAYESVMTIDVDLREYPIGTGFKVVSHCLAASNGQTKTVAIGIDGNQVLASSLTTTTAPNGVFIHHEATVLHSDTPKSIAFGFVMVGVDLDAVACGADNSLSIDWDQKITISVDVNNATAASDISVYALQVIPLK
tara:strand:+ start:9543 stop:11132 length:1590 start_codon:yes stop_codon:yes gene_type:complete